MAKSAKTGSAGGGAGAILAFGLGLVLILGIAGTPFYAKMLQSDENRAGDLVRDDVEAVRRIVLNVDENLAAMQQLAALTGESKDKASPDELLKDNPKMLDGVLADLDASARRLQKAAGDDSAKKLKGFTKTVESGRPNLSKADKDLRNTYVKKNDELLKEARGIVTRIKGVKSGNVSATSLLSVNRVLTLLAMTEGRIAANRAEFERLLADDLRSEAEHRLADVTILKTAIAKTSVEKPTTELEAVNKSIEAADAQLAAIGKVVDAVSADIANKQGAHDAAKTAADMARRSLAAMDAQGAPGPSGIAAYKSQYEQLSDQARKAEAMMDELENGTLAGAALSADEADDLLNGKYEGGKVQPGLRDLKMALGHLQAQQETLRKFKTELVVRQKSMQDRDALLDTTKSDLTGVTATLADEINAVIAEAKKHDGEAAKASAVAIKSYKEGANLASQAARAAKKRRDDSRPGQAQAGQVERAADRMVKDSDSEAAMHVLIADIGYLSALESWRQMRALESQFRTETAVAEATGGDKPAEPTAEVDGLRKDGQTQAEAAVKAYASAGAMIKSSQFKGLETGSYTGANFVWQVQVAQAAADLLKSQLAADKADADTARNDAYTLLTDAVKNREGSPLLTPALSTLLYLQRTAE